MIALKGEPGRPGENGLPGYDGWPGEKGNLAVSRQNLSLGCPIRSDTNWAVQLQKNARGIRK